nr:MAG TPA: 43 kDa tail protein [Caudoviricetes sp.]
MDESHSEKITHAPLRVRYELIVMHDRKDMYLIDPQDGVTLDRSPDLAPAKLSFRVFKDKVLNIEEGDLVNFKVNGKLVFVGYIFEKKRSKDNFIEVTAYDQCKYLKSEGYYVFDGKKTASELIKALAEDLAIKVGDITPTTYKIGYIYDGKTYQDIILDMLKQTSIYSPAIPVMKPLKKQTDSNFTGPNGTYYEQNDIDYLTSHGYKQEAALAELAKSDKYKKQDEDMKERKPVYIAYDDNGLLVVKELNDMITDVLIDATQVGDYSYTSSIEDTFTQILVVREANVMKDGKKTKEFLRTGSAAAKNEIAKWGVLQKVIKPDDKKTNVIEFAKNKLETLAKKTHTLRLKECLGHTEIRPGSGIWLNFNVGDQIINELVYVQAVTHNFNNNKHVMDLDVIYFDKQKPDITVIDNGDEEIRKRIQAMNKKSGGTANGSGASGNATATNAGVQAGFDSIEGTSSPYGDVGCVDRATAGGSYYNSDLADAYNQGIKDVPGLKTFMNGRGYAIESFNGTANPGDILIYDGDEHVVIADGAGGCVGNSTKAGSVIHYSDVNYAYHNGTPPTHIIRTGVK